MQRISLANTPLLRGHAVGFKIQPLHSDPLTVWGVYMPFEVPLKWPRSMTTFVTVSQTHHLPSWGETGMPPSSRLTGRIAQEI